MAGRQSLQEFQARLARRLADPQGEARTSDWLGMAWHGVHALLPLALAGEVFSPSALQPVSHTQPWVQGVAALRGGICLVLDWVRLLKLSGEASAPLTEAEDAVHYWVSFNPDSGVPAALCADQLLGLRSRADFISDDTMPGNADSGRAVEALVRVWRDAAGQPWHEIDLLKLARSAEFMNPYLSGFVAREV